MYQQQKNRKKCCDEGIIHYIKNIWYIEINLNDMQNLFTKIQEPIDRNYMRLM